MRKLTPYLIIAAVAVVAIAVVFRVKALKDLVLGTTAA